MVYRVNRWDRQRRERFAILVACHHVTIIHTQPDSTIYCDMLLLNFVPLFY